jgi:hypothetical protein
VTEPMYRCPKCNTMTEVGHGFGLCPVCREPKKPVLYGLVRDNPKTPEGKYLVVRRDGTIPTWPSFVLGGADPMSPATLRFYSIYGFIRGHFTWAFVKAAWRWARTMKQWRKEHGTGDPGRGIHRADDPAIVEQMKKGMSA